MKIANQTINTLAYIPLHYGKDYLEYVLTSIHEFVDTVLILYTSRPSYGYRSNLPNPDSEKELKAICDKFHKIVWQDVTGRATRENVHRELAYDFARNSRNYINGKKYDIVLAVDADEVWNPEKVEEAIYTAYSSTYHFHCIEGSKWSHFWKGFKEVNVDGFYPMRLANLNNNVRNQDIIAAGRIYHMGYAISEEAMRYKISCHGHKSEIASTWFTDKWLNYERGVTTHLHPASRDIWYETQDFEEDLPEILKTHPYYEPSE